MSSSINKSDSLYATFAHQNAPNSLPRRTTAVATLGEVGASYAVYEKNWMCPDCGNENYARRERCYRCRGKKPLAEITALLAPEDASEHQWREALDPMTNQIYYYNMETKQTQWERPKEMGEAPLNTGWFGRGNIKEEKRNYKEENAAYLTRPAKKQMDFVPQATGQLEGAFEYNIWYHKYIGDHWGNEKSRDPATSRCHLEEDAGKTRAGTLSKSNRYFCIHFARGMCARGEECTYYHHLPLLEDELRIGMMHDCFGRERHATDKDDMSGVGNFTRNSRTLYVAGIKNVVEEAKELEKELWQHFSEWGEVEQINIIHRLNICFIRYRYRISAEFAKEAMTNQSIQQDEVISIKWAYDDPNPIAKDAAHRADQDAMIAVVKSRDIDTTEAAYEYPADYHLKRKQIESGETEYMGDQENGVKRQRYNETEADEALISEYPDTDAQYIGYAKQEGEEEEEDEDEEEEEYEQENEDMEKEKQKGKNPTDKIYNEQDNQSNDNRQPSRKEDEEEEENQAKK